MALYTRINALLEPSMTVLDFGASRGAQLNDQRSSIRNELSRLQGKVKKVIGVNLDCTVTKNSLLDEAHVVNWESPLPFAPDTFELTYAGAWAIRITNDPNSLSSSSRLYCS